MSNLSRYISLASIDFSRMPSVSANLCSKLPTTSGVYFILDSSDVLWYIGFSHNLSQRLAGHPILASLKKRGIRELRIFWLETDFCRNEKLMIAYLRPELNLRVPKLNDLEKGMLEKFFPHSNFWVCRISRNNRFYLVTQHENKLLLVDETWPYSNPSNNEVLV